jgi:hypothetical protein
MDQKTATAINTELRAAATKILAAHGFKVDRTNASFRPAGSGMADFNFGLSAIAADADPHRDAFIRYASRYGLSADLLDKTVVLDGTTFRIAGLDVMRRRYPVRLTNVRTGKPVVYTLEAVKAALPKAA